MATAELTRARPRLNLIAAVLLVLAAGPIAAAFAYAVATGTPVRDAAVACLLLSPALIYLALVRPFMFPYGLYVLLIPYDTLLGLPPEGTITKFVGIVSIAVLLFYCLRVRKIAPLTNALRVMIAFVVWMSVSLLWSVNLEHSLPWIPTYFGLVLLYAALTLTPLDIKDFKFLLGLVVFSFLVASFVGMANFHGITHAGTQNLATADQDRLILKMGDNEVDPNDYADAFVFPIAIATMLTLRSRRFFSKLAGLAAVGSMTAAMLMAGSREALLTIVAVFAYYFWRSRYRAQLAGLGLVVAIAVMPLTPTLIDRFQLAISTGGAGRTSIWGVGLAAAKHYALLGSGIGTFPDVYNQFYLSVPQIHPYGWNGPPHNVILHFLVELGVIGLAAVVFFFVTNFTMLRAIAKDHPLFDYRIVMEAGLLSVCSASLFIDTLNLKWVWVVFSMIAQLVFLAATFRRTAQTAAPKEGRPELAGQN